MQELSAREQVALCFYTGAKTPEEAINLILQKALNDAVDHLDWTEHSGYKKACYALAKWRGSVECFVDPDEEIEGMDRNLSIEKKIELVYAQLNREMASYNSFEAWEMDRD